MKSGWVAESTWSDGRRGADKNSLIAMTGRRGGLKWQDNRVRIWVGMGCFCCSRRKRWWWWRYKTLNRYFELSPPPSLLHVHFDNWYKRTAGIRPVKYWLCSLFFSSLPHDVQMHGCFDVGLGPPPPAEPHLVPTNPLTYLSDHDLHNSHSNLSSTHMPGTPSEMSSPCQSEWMWKKWNKRPSWLSSKDDV